MEEKKRKRRRRRVRRSNGRLNAKTKNRVIKRDGYKCLQCGSTEELTVDHVIPVKRGGSNRIENLQTLCLFCNQEKGTMLYGEFTPSRSRKKK